MREMYYKDMIFEEYYPRVKVEKASLHRLGEAGRVFISPNRCRSMCAFFDEADVLKYGSNDDTIDLSREHLYILEIRCCT